MELNFSQLIILAVLIETVVTTIAWVTDAQFSWQSLTALVITDYVTRYLILLKTEAVPIFI